MKQSTMKIKILAYGVSLIVVTLGFSALYSVSRSSHLIKYQYQPSESKKTTTVIQDSVNNFEASNFADPNEAFEQLQARYLLQEPSPEQLSSMVLGVGQHQVSLGTIHHVNPRVSRAVFDEIVEILTTFNDCPIFDSCQMDPGDTYQYDNINELRSIYNNCQAIEKINEKGQVVFHSIEIPKDNDQLDLSDAQIQEVIQIVQSKTDQGLSLADSMLHVDDYLELNDNGKTTHFQLYHLRHYISGNQFPNSLKDIRELIIQSNDQYLSGWQETDDYHLFFEIKSNSILNPQVTIGNSYEISIY